MTLLDRYFSTRILVVFLKTVVTLVFLFVLMDYMIERRSVAYKNDVPFSVLLTYYFVRIPQILAQYQIAALSMLVASLLVLGDAAQHNEVTAALAGGISLRRLVRMPIILAALMAVGLLLFQDTLGVASGKARQTIESRYLKSNLKGNRTGVSWANLSGDWSCHVMKFNRLALTGEQVFLHAIRKDSVEQLQARRLYWDPARSQWMLEDGRWFVFDPVKGWQSEVRHISLCPAPIKETPEELFALEAPPDSKTVFQLLADIRSAEKRLMPTGASRADFHAKFSQPALAFVIIWLAIPFALRLRRGGLAIGFSISIMAGLAYLVLFRVSMAFGHVDRLDPIVAAWSANVLFLILGVTLFCRLRT